MIELINAWVEEVANNYFRDYGTTSFFSDPYKAQEFVESNFLNNPRLRNIEKQILLENSKNSLEFALQSTNDPAQAALFYWTSMGDYILLNTNDERLQNMFEVGKAAAQDTTDLTFDEDAPSNLKIPWWLILFPIGFLFLRKK